MLDSLRRAFALSDLRTRLLFTLWMFFVFRIGAHVPVPGIDPTRLAELFQGGSLFGLIDIFAGGAFSRFTVFAMSITPYINASIIMQLLTLVIPQVEEWSKEGQEGQRKMTEWTRYGTVILAVLQAIGLAFFLRAQGAVLDPGVGSLAIIVLTLTAGTTFLMWVGEQITEYGIGNGISLLIFAGIVSRLPAGAGSVVTYLQTGRISLFNLIVAGLVGLIIIAGIVYVTQGRRQIPVQYAKRVVGRRMYGGQSSHIPIRVNQAGVIPVIFAASLLALPYTLAQFVQAPWAQAVAQQLSFGSAAYVLVYAGLIVFFTYFYTAVTFNTQDVADNVKKYGGFIPGLRPGRPTAQYLGKVLERITLIGALFLAAVAVLPVYFGQLTNIPNVYFGGTALLIVVGVSLETVKQLEAHLLMRHYQGFIR